MYCRNCGSENDDGVMLCRKCGQFLEYVEDDVEQEENSAIVKEKEQSVIKNLLYIGLLVIIAIGVILMATKIHDIKERYRYENMNHDDMEEEMDEFEEEIEEFVDEISQSGETQELLGNLSYGNSESENQEEMTILLKCNRQI